MSSEKVTPALANSSGKSAESPDSRSQLQDRYNASPYFTKKPLGIGKHRKLPTWLDHFNARDLKELTKCSISIWITTLFIFINPTLRFLGQAAFFGSLVQFFAPPSGIVFIQLMALLTVIIGACLGWAWGVITMKAALATRPAADLNARLASLQQSASQNTTYPVQASGASYTQVAIYSGYMLDTRVSVTYFCMICLFVYFIARLRVKAPKLTLLSIFAIIISDIFLTIAPLLPTFNGTIPQTLIKPAAIAVGVGAVCNVLIFPRSTSHAVLDGMQDVLKPMSEFLDAASLYLHDASRHMQLDHMKKARRQVIEMYKAQEALLGFIGLDASVGRWSADDVSSLREPLRRTLTSFLSLMQFYISREQAKAKNENYSKLREESRPREKEDGKLHGVGNLQLSKALDFQERMQHPEMMQSFTDSLKILSRLSDSFIETCQKCLAAVNEGLTESNNRRWFKRLTEDQCKELRDRHSDLLQHLRSERVQMTEKTSTELWSSREDLFDEKGIYKENYPSTKVSPSLAGTILTLSLEKKMSNFASALEELLEIIVLLEGQRTKTRLWLPKSLQKLFGWAIDQDTAVPGALSRTITSDQRGSKEKKPKPKRGLKARKQQKQQAKGDRTAAYQLEELKHRHEGRQRNKSGQLLLGFFRWLSNTEGLYALRVVVVTIAVGVPAVIPTTAGFFYREKGLWAVIMAQTGLVEFTADFIFGFGIRVVGTVLGGVIGLMMWYIGAGNGPGNPYGMAAISALVIVFFVYLRLFAPPVALQGTILAAATAFLVMAYSWSDTHIPSYGNPGVGYTVFWRRLLLVLVGMAASAIVTLFPRPPSANRHFRQLLSESLESIKNRYALFTATSQDGTDPPPDLLKVAQKGAIDAAEVLMSIAGPIKLVRFEFSSSPFDATNLGNVCQLCSELNLNITQLLLYATTLSGNAKTRFILISGALNDELVGEIMAVLTLLQHSLMSGEPLPAVLPVPLLARSLEMARTRLVQYRERQHNNDPSLQIDVILTKEMVMEEGFRHYCEALGAFIEMMSTLDELVIVVKRAVGETCVVDMHRDVEAASLE